MSDYADFAQVYDLFYSDTLDDIEMYRGFAQRTGGRILEIGVGTARVAAALAQAGHSVTGIDRSEAMLKIARDKVEGLGLSERVTLTQADMREFELDVRFDLAIVPINTFMHNLTLNEQVAALNCIKRHLTPQGLLVIDLFNPDPSQPNERQLLLHNIRRDANGQAILQFTTRTFDWESQRSSVVFIVDEPDESGLIKRTVFSFELRFLFRNEIELLLREAAFKLDAVYGSYDLEPFDSGVEQMIVVARP